MEIINTLLGIPLGYIFYFCYQLAGNFGIAVLLFTLATKLVLFPLSLLAQKNAITMVRIQPQLEDIKRRFEGNNTLILEEQKALYKREHYSMLKGVLPMLVQIPLILGLIYVIYNPLQHMLHIEPAIIQVLIDQASLLTGIPVSELGFAAQLKVMELVQADPAAFVSLAGVGDVLTQIQAINMDFLGVNLSQNPSLTWPAILYPLLSGVSALVLSLYQNRYYILQKTAGRLSKWGMTLFLVAFSGYFAAVLPMGLGLYWTAGNLFSILVVWLCNAIYNPKKFLETDAPQTHPALSRAERAAARSLKRELGRRQRRDAARFAAARDRQLVFYSESSGFYKYFQGLIEWLLANSEETIHYVTSDPDDQVFSLAAKRDDERWQVYYIGPSALISFMMKLDAQMVLMTMPDLEKYHIKRSLVRKDIEYVYLDHGMGSFHLMLRENALDHFDTVFCYGPNHIAEIRESELLYDLPEKRLVKSGFPLFDALVASVASSPERAAAGREPPTILIAPSWQPGNILESCFEQTVRPLLDQGYRVVVRPHPEFVKRFRNKIDVLVEHYAASEPCLSFELDFSSNETVYTADLVVTDWSTIAQEFSFGSKRPSVFINTEMKVMNPNWQRLDTVPLEISLRDKLGVSLNPEELSRIGDVADDLISRRDEYRDSITA
ncbi:MAG: membrane protein insertase YidC, partial [Coriobacteriales bacterium]|nr:membrane protein insertase YidC [Coriobacteriales bacterium]